MKIVVNDIAASKAGAMTVLKEFYNSVKKYGSEHEWVFLLGDSYLEETDNIHIIALPGIKRRKLRKVCFDCFTGKFFVSKLKPDIYISLQNIICFGLHIPQILFVHQSIPFQDKKVFSLLNKKERDAALYQWFIAPLILSSIKKATRTVVQTEWMYKSVLKKTGIPPETICAIRPNVIDVSVPRDGNRFVQSSFIYPTSEIVYKNNDCLFEACNILDKDDINYSLCMTLSNGPHNERIQYIGHIPYEKLIDSYNESTLVFPSYIESFGYPLVEARSMGTLILASDCPFSHELLDDYQNAYFFDPFAPRDLAELMKKVVTGEISRIDCTPRNQDDSDCWLRFLNLALSDDIFSSK